MNNFKKIGLTALAGSLVTLGSAQAGELSVSGGINTTLKFGKGGGNTGRTIGADRDFTFSGGKLKAAMNTKASKDFHELWVKMIQDSGAKNWSTHTWYQVGTDLGAGASAMIFDADILGYFMNGGDNKEAGNIGYAPFAANPNASAPTPNVWIWSLAMSSFSKQKDA